MSAKKATPGSTPLAQARRIVVKVGSALLEKESGPMVVGPQYSCCLPNDSAVPPNATPAYSSIGRIRV